MITKGILFTDGACKGNPGQMSAGIVLKSESGQVILQHGEKLGHGTNNEAEYKALLIGLKKAREKNIKDLMVYSDSKLLVQHVNGKWNPQTPHLVDIMMKIRNEINFFDNINVQHVRREFNSLADGMANSVFV